MRTVTKEFKIYKFLETCVQNRVIEKFRESEAQEYIPDYIRDYWKEHLENIGFIDPEIRCSGFCCQGDGASFIARVDLVRLFDSIVMSDQWDNDLKLERMILLAEKDLIEVYISESRGSGYYMHENSVSFECIENSHSYNGVLLGNERIDLTTMIGEYARDIMRKIYSDLHDDYYFRQSDENIKELIEINDYEFIENGDIYSQ